MTICSISGCGKHCFGRGWYNMHYSRWRRHGDPEHVGRVVYGTAEERFWAKVDLSGSCWEWRGSLGSDGYGVFGAVADRANRKLVYAHRWAYEHLVGPIPDGLGLDHLYRNRRCVNPDHLEPVTTAENIARSPIHYGARSHCAEGHEFTPDNTLIRSDGGRRCRTCKRNRQRDQRKKVGV